MRQHHHGQAQREHHHGERHHAREQVTADRRDRSQTGRGDGTDADGRLYVQSGQGTIDFGVVPRFVVPGATAPSGGLMAPMPGVVIDVRCAAGDRVEAGQTLVVLEAMKMEHHVRAPSDGAVADVRVAKGRHVENGALLLVFEPADGPEA